MAVRTSFLPGHLLPAWKPARPGEPEAHLRVRLLLHNAGQAGHKPTIHSDIEKPLIETLRTICPGCNKNPGIARHLAQYLARKCQGLDGPDLNKLVVDTFTELSDLERTREAVRDELVDVWQRSRGRPMTEDYLRTNPRALTGKYSMYICELLFRRPAVDYVRSPEFLAYAGTKPKPQPVSPAREISLPDRLPAPALAKPAEIKPDLASQLRETIFCRYRTKIGEKGPSRGGYLQGVYHLLEKEAEMREVTAGDEGLVVDQLLVERARELVHDLTERKLERLGFTLGQLAGTGRDSRDLLVEAFPLFRLTRQYLESVPVIGIEETAPAAEPDPIRSKFDLGREKIFAGHPHGAFIQRVYERLGTSHDRVEAKQLEEAKQMICSSTYEDFGKMKIWHATVDGEALPLFEFVARCLPLFNLNRRDFAYLDWTTLESGKANVVHRFYKHNPDLRAAVEAAGTRLASIKTVDQLETGELERLVQLRARLIKLITKNNLIKWGLDGHRRCPGIKSNTELIKNCFPLTAHPVFDPFPWPPKRSKLDTVLDPARAD